jgi:hypothetical protein
MISMAVAARVFQPMALYRVAMVDAPAFAPGLFFVPVRRR